MHDKPIPSELMEALNTHPSEIERENKTFDKAIQSGKLKWQKNRNPMRHLTPKKKKRKK